MIKVKEINLKDEFKGTKTFRRQGRENPILNGKIILLEKGGVIDLTMESVLPSPLVPLVHPHPPEDSPHRSHSYYLIKDKVNDPQG